MRIGSKHLALLISLSVLLPLILKAQDMGVNLSVQESNEAAIEKYRSALAIDPNDTTANYQMAVALNEAGKGMKALPYLKRVYLAKGVSTKLVADAYGLSGEILADHGKLKKGIKTYVKGIREVKGKQDASGPLQTLHHDLSLTYLKDKQYANAELNSSAAVFYGPKNPQLYWTLGKISLQTNKRGQALLAFLKLIIEGQIKAKCRCF